MTARFDAGPLVAEYGDEALVRELARILIENAEAELRQIFTAVDTMDAGALRAGAHRLRGAVATFNAADATALAQALENMGASGDLAEARRIADQLADDVRQLCSGAEAWLMRGADGRSG